MLKKIKHILVLAGSALFGLLQPAKAQQNDTLVHVRDFVRILKEFKQVPMYAEIDVVNSTNYITSTDDTVTVHGKFYLQAANSYVRYGEFEQVVSDSFALLVNDQAKKLLLYQNAEPVNARMRDLISAPVPDSSILTLAAVYQSSSQLLANNRAAVTLSTRARVLDLPLARQEIEVEYDTERNLPVHVKTIKRMLLNIDSATYARLGQEGMQANLVTFGNNYFLVREQRVSYEYTVLVPGSNVQPPVLISNRIRRNAQGQFVPAESYSNYQLQVIN
jgi:hypothetical protein